MPAIPAVTGTPITTQTQSGPQKVGDDTGFNSDMFLKMLTASMKYQNPMSPSSADQFMQSTSQLTMVEMTQKMVNAMGNSSAWQQAALASSMINQTATFSTASGNDAVGIVKGYTSTSSGPVLDIDVNGKIQQVVLANVHKIAGSTPD